jgi:hypothetical protein
LAGSSIFAVRTSYIPNKLGWIIGSVIAIILIFLYVYEVIVLGDKVFPNVKRQTWAGRFTLFVCLVFCSLSTGVYTVGWLENKAFGRKYTVPVRVLLKGKSGRRYSYCNTTMKISGVFTKSINQSICLSKTEYKSLKKSNTNQFLATYERSNFGIYFVGIYH